MAASRSFAISGGTPGMSASTQGASGVAATGTAEEVVPGFDVVATTELGLGAGPHAASESAATASARDQEGEQVRIEGPTLASSVREGHRAGSFVPRAGPRKRPGDRASARFRPETMRASFILLGFLATGCAGHALTAASPNVPGATPAWVTPYTPEQEALLAPSNAHINVPARRVFPNLEKFAYSDDVILGDPREAVRVTQLVAEAVEHYAGTTISRRPAPSSRTPPCSTARAARTSPTRGRSPSSTARGRATSPFRP